MNDFKLPNIEVGEVVLWYPTANRYEEPAVAFVTHRGERTLALSVIVKDMPTLHCVDGVRHVDDPALLKIKDPPAGAWDFKPSRKPEGVKQPDPVKKAG